MGAMAAKHCENDADWEIKGTVIASVDALSVGAH